MKKWFSAFLDWIQTSRIAQTEMNSKNNHAVWYDAQSLAMALFADSVELAGKIMSRAVDRLDRQMDTSGLFPLELSEQTSVNVWTVETPSGKSLKKAFQAILPFITRE